MVKKKSRSLKAEPGKYKIKPGQPTIIVGMRGGGQKPWKGTFPTSKTSMDIVTTSTTTSGNSVTAPQMNHLVETVDMARTYKPFISKVKFSISLKNGLTIEIERKPSKIVRKKKEGKK